MTEDKPFRKDDLVRRTRTPPHARTNPDYAIGHTFLIAEVKRHVVVDRKGNSHVKDSIEHISEGHR